MGAFPHPGVPGYALLDSGHGEKLERVGGMVLRRPDPQALWRPGQDAATWAAADYRFVRESDRGGRWEKRAASLPDTWEMETRGLVLRIQPTPFKHMGLFPEQAANWDWVAARRGTLVAEESDAPPRLLNLFGYTGVASLLAARDGWQVTHVDASRASLDWAAANQRLSGLPEDGVRWILEDALKFAAREVRRGRHYDGILLDPPHYGRGPKGEKWQFEQGIAPLLEACGALLTPRPGAFLVLSTYAVGYSPLAFENMLREFGAGQVESGELALPEESGGRLLPCGFCARFLRADGA